MRTVAGTARAVLQPEALGMRGASFTKELDVTTEEWRALLDLSAQVKAGLAAPIEALYPQLARSNA